MSEESLLIKRVNISKFDNFSTYTWIHSESYNFFERVLIRKTLKNIIPEGKFALDIGCGPGLVLREMYHIYRYCVGVDISRGILQYAKSRLKVEEKRNIDLLCADVEYLPFKNSIFEVVAMYSVLHHLPNLNTALKEVHKAMASNSALILFHEPNEIYTRSILEKTLVRSLEKVRAVLLKSVHRRQYLRVRLEVQQRSTKLGKLENLADIHSVKGFNIINLKMLLENCGFVVNLIKTRLQSFMASFSRLGWPFSFLAFFDFVLSELPILKNYLPLLLCVAKKSHGPDLN